MIETKGLTKVYRETTAVDHIDLVIKEGEAFGLLGPNGAGKTTIILMLSTLLETTSGEAHVFGHDIIKEPQLVKRDIGIVFQEPSLDERLTGVENLEIQAALYDVPKSERKGRLLEMLDFVGLSEWGDVPTGKYSGGMKRRLEIARCLVHKPKVLLLDEPTLGLDPSAREKIWEHIKGLFPMTVVIATNYIEEAEALCGRIGIVDSGRIVAVGTPEQLKASLKVDFGRIKTGNPEKLKSVMEALPYIKNIKADRENILFNILEGKRKELLGALAEFDLDSIEIRRPTLNDVFFQFTGKSIEVGMERPTKRRGLGRRKNRR